MVDRADLWSESSSDAELITAARSGDAAAFGTLYERHAAAARTVARQYTTSTADAEDVTADAFARVFAVVQAGGGPDVAFRAYLFTVVRRLAYAGARSGRKVEPTDDMVVFENAFGAQGSVEDPALAGFERGVVAKAYSSLPERWQAALWYTEVEGLSAAQIAPLLGLTANGVAALSYRAREGLRQAYLQQHLARPISAGCRGVNEKLGAYVRGGLAKRETAQVAAHLEGCVECRALVLELGDVNHGMRIFVAPLILGVAGLGALASPLPVGGIGIGVSLVVGAGTASGAGVAAGTSVGVGTGVAAGTGAGVGSSVGVGTGVAAGSSVAAGTGVAAGASVSAGATGAVGAGVAGSTAGAVGAGVAAGTGTAVGAGAGAAAGAAGAGAVAGAGVAVGAGASAGASGAVGAVAGALATHAGLVGVGAASAGAATGAIATGAVATGAIATGAVATGAIATGAVATGAVATGAIATGAVATTGGIAALFASVPMGISSAVVAGLVGTSLAVAGATGAFTSDGADPVFSSQSQSPFSSPSAPASAAPGTSTAPATVSPSDVPTLDVPTLAPAATVPSVGTPTPPVATPATAATVDPAVPATPTTNGAIVPTPAPTPTAPVVPPVPTPALLAISPGPGGLAMTAGGGGVLSFAIANTGQTAARNVTAELALPAGVEFAGLSATGTAWVCTPGAGSATCTTSELPASSSTSLAVNVGVGEDVAATDSVNVELTVVSDSARTQLLTSASIAPAPARLALDAPAEVRLSGAAASTVTIDVRNAGATLASPVRLDITLPAGVSWAPSATGSWDCVATADSLGVTCTVASLAGRALLPLPLSLLSDGTSAGAAGSMTVSATFDDPAGAPAVVLSVPVQVVPTPAELTLSAPAVLRITRGASTTLQLQFANLGETDADDVSVHLDAPGGVGLAPDGAGLPAAACGLFESSVGITCLLGLIPAKSGVRTFSLTLTSDASVATDSTVRVSLSAPAALDSLPTTISLQATDLVAPKAVAPGAAAPDQDGDVRG